jgi:hypothetical protein
VSGRAHVRRCHGRELIALINDQRALLRDDVHFALPDHDEVGPLLHVYHPTMGLNGESSVRSTNVYEERSLGIFEQDNDNTENEADYPESDSRVAIWGRYLGRHVRRQLSFGMPRLFLSSCARASK